MSRPGPSFLGSDEGDAIIARLADAEALTIVVGAGSSVESGLSDWDALVRALLLTVADAAGLESADRDAFVDWTISRDGLPAAGAVAKAALGGRFHKTLRTALYRGGADFAPGPIAHGVAQLRVQHTSDLTEIVTTNYDLLLEEALRFQLASTKPGAMIRSTTGGDVRRDHEFLVRHIHGIVPPSGSSSGPVVLSEADYHLMQHPEAWQEQYFAERLRATLCLFVGTSLSDPNLLRYLYRSRAEQAPAHVACFARQQDAMLYEHATKAVARIREETVEARWGAVGIQPVQVDHYSQVAQVLFEVAQRRRVGSAYIPYRRRLAEWYEAVRETTLSTRSPGFQEHQDRLQSILADVTLAIRRVLDSHGIDLTTGERLGCSLWVHWPDEGTLVNWASSDRVWRDPATLEPVPVSWTSPFVSVQAFCTGSLVSFSTREQAATRWNHVLGVPLYLEDDDLFGRLPVGVATVASTLVEADSLLGRGLDVFRTEVAPEIGAQLSDLLRPE